MRSPPDFAGEPEKTAPPGEKALTVLYNKKKDILLKMSFSIKVAMTYSPTNLFTGSTIPAAIGHAQCGKVTPRGSRLAGIVKFESEVRWCRQHKVARSMDGVHGFSRKKVWISIRL